MFFDGTATCSGRCTRFAHLIPRTTQACESSSNDNLIVQAMQYLHAPCRESYAVINTNLFKR